MHNVRSKWHEFHHRSQDRYQILREETHIMTHLSKAKTKWNTDSQACGLNKLSFVDDDLPTHASQLLFFRGHRLGVEDEMLEMHSGGVVEGAHGATSEVGTKLRGKKCNTLRMIF